MEFRRIRGGGTLIVPLAVLALSACGGGGSGSSPGPLPTANPTANPTATPTASPSPNPSAAGNAFTYAGVLTQTVTLYATPPPPPALSGGASPGPTSTPWVSTTKQTVTQNVSVSTGQSFGGQNNLTNLATKETDAGQLQTTSVTSQNYFSYKTDPSRANGLDVTEIGMSSTDSNGVALQSVLGTGNGLVEKLPYVYSGQWTNSATRTDSENDPDGEAITANYAADGTYQEQFTYPENGTASALTRDDGSAVYSVPLLGATGGANSGLTVEPPVDGQITVGFSVGFQASAFEISDWYPMAPPNFASDTYIDEGSTSLPSSCNVGSAYQSAAVEKVIETKHRIDPLFGEYETDQITQYTSGSYGLLCEVVSDDLKAFYDFSGQAGVVLGFTYTTPPSPLDETTVSETLALQSARYASASSTRRGQSSAQQVVSRAVLPQPSLARARMILAAAHSRHARALSTAVRSGAARRPTK